MDKATLKALKERLLKEEMAEMPIEKQTSTKQRSRWEAESLLISLKWPYPELRKKDCISCGRAFLTNYNATAYCSNECVRTDFKRYGLKWNPDKSFFDQWGVMEAPLIVSPDSIRAMRHLLNLVDQGNLEVSHNQEQDYGGLHKEEVLIEAEPDFQIPDNVDETPKEHEIDPEFLAILDALDD